VRKREHDVEDHIDEQRVGGTRKKYTKHSKRRGEISVVK
jgi:hypothetical protein